MKSFNFRVQSSRIAMVIVALTLFASQAEAQARSRGTNGGGGGGVILCPGQAPELTDFWEYQQTNKTGDIAARLKWLRGLNYEQAKQLYARNLALLYNEGDEAASGIAKLIDKLMGATQKALNASNTSITIDIGEYDMSHLKVIVDKQVMDPRDSGVISNLEKTNCKEERVAVSSYQETTVKTEDDIYIKSTTTIRLRRPDLFVNLPVIDQIALLLGHEFIYSASQGNIGRLEKFYKERSDSSMVRQVNAWVAMAKPQDFEDFHWRPESSHRVLYCSASIDRLKIDDPHSDEIEFNLYIDQKNKKTIFEMSHYKAYHVTLSVRADLAISEDMFLIPKKLDTNVPSGPSRRFKLKMKLNEQQTVRAKLFQANVGQNIFSFTSNQIPDLRDTSFSLEFIGAPNNRVWTKVLNKYGDVEFFGEVNCNARDESFK